MIKNQNKNNSTNNTAKAPSKKQPIEFIVTNNFSGTRNLSEVLAKLAMTEINTITENKNQTNN